MITAEYLRSRLRYEPETGDFYWLPKDVTLAKNRQWNGQFAGKQAGCIHPATGYVVITLSHAAGRWRLYPAHRLAWLYMTGNWPAEVDHKDRNRSNNRWANLREATTSQNQANTGPQANNTSGVKGVHWSPRHKAWAARIMVGGRRLFLGFFKDKSAAAGAYADAARKHFGDFAA